ncbi:MAG: CRISPR-associated endonuclease Cas2 [Deltaproteobacteria bacterium]|nr:MAG: CRISPR-associated endonuclease Cas2 [Deltaproteobacteria bacterium]
MMLAVICYDISSNKHRAKLHKFLKEYGLNTQKSIFECEVDLEALQAIVSEAQQRINPQTDSFRIYRICAQCQKRVVVSGLGIKVENLDFMIC